MHLHRTFSLTIAISVGTLIGCATTPKQTVELSATVGRDIEAVHLAHVALANKYFDRMDADVNAFVDGAYRLYSIDHNMRDFQLIDKVTHPSKAGEDLDALDVMEVFVDGITADLEDMRRTLLRPVREQRAKVIGSLEGAYRRIQDGQSIVTAHLASVEKVQNMQDELLAKGGLQGLRETLVDSTAKASDQIEELTRKAEYSRDKIGEFRTTIENVKKATQSIGK